VSCGAYIGIYRWQFKLVDFAVCMVVNVCGVVGEDIHSQEAAIGDELLAYK
jgi:hypothetical protein